MATLFGWVALAVYVVYLSLPRPAAKVINAVLRRW